MNLERALELWIEITGINPNDSTIRLRDMDVHRANDVIKRSMQVDHTYVTTLMLLGMYLDDYSEDRKVALKDIIADFSTVTAWLDKIREFQSIINSDEMQEIKIAFKSSLREALEHYRVREEVANLILEKEPILAELRYSAFNSINKLETRQFSHGEPSNKKPVIYDNLYLFKDINTLLEWMLSVDSGIVLALIQEGDVSSSYFVFAIRNGGTLTLVTDREREAHPLASSLSRGRARGRSFFERIESNHFPYSVMDIKFGDNNRAYVNTDDQSIQLSQDGMPIAEIRNLEPDEIVWAVMMFGLLNEKFFKENYRTETLSYTAKMMIESERLAEKAEERGIVLYGYQPLVVPAITSEVMTTEKLKDVFRFESTGFSDWMVDRYSVPNEAFDVLQNSNVLTITDGTKETSIELQKMNLSAFGDAERLQKDRLFLARYNQAKVIQERANAEFEEREEEVIQWYKNAVRKNLPALYESIANRKFIVEDKENAHTSNGGWTRRAEDGNILRIGLVKEESYQRRIFCKIGGKDFKFNNLTCAVNDTKAYLVAHFHVRTPEMLAKICGCEISELHELIQHWRYSKDSKGNHILDRVDPLDWALKDPWLEVRFDVFIYLSKRGFNTLCKQYGTEHAGFWNKKEEPEDKGGMWSHTIKW